jgi:hypothetical protein
MYVAIPIVHTGAFDMSDTRILIDFLADIIFLGLGPMAVVFLWLQWKSYKMQKRQLELQEWSATFIEEIRDRVTSPWP